MSRKERSALVSELDALPPDVPRVLLSTGKLVGEGFDHPPLDTLVLAADAHQPFQTIMDD
jgi:superfamily II DNA or RNA helicase